jgi:phage baseplate assembly protein gpV
VHTSVRTTAAAVASLALLSPVLLSTPAQAARKPAKKPQKIATTVTISPAFDYNSSTHRVTVKGKVGSKKAFCRTKRVVKLRQVTDGQDAGRTKTKKNGSWAVTFDGNRIMPGKFRATVLRKTVKVKGRTYVCKKAVVRSTIGND